MGILTGKRRLAALREAEIRPTLRQASPKTPPQPQ
jgi:hypothetical protein